MERSPSDFNFAMMFVIALSEPASTTSVGALSFAITTSSDGSIRLLTVSASLGTAIIAPSLLAAASAMSSPLLRAVAKRAFSSIRPEAANADSSPKLCPAIASASRPNALSK